MRAKYLQLQNWLIKAVSRIIFTREAMNEQAIKCALCVWKYVALIFALSIREKHRELRALVYPTTCLTIVLHVVYLPRCVEFACILLYLALSYRGKRRESRRAEYPLFCPPMTEESPLPLCYTLPLSLING